MDPSSVSIVISNYNYGRYLADAVDSALGQTRPPADVVVVDDGSTDDFRQILARYRGRIRTVLQENGGQPAALNAGVTASTGRIVMLLDADDRLAPEAVEAVLAAWSPEVVRVQFRLELIDDAGHPLGVRLPGGRIRRGQDVRHMILSEGRYPATGATGVAYDRRVLERIMPIPEGEWWQTPGVYLQLLAPFLGRAVSIDRVLGEVRVHGANKWVVGQPTPERLRDYLEQDDRAEALLREWAPELDIELPVDWGLRIPNHLQARLASLRWDPERHPYPADRPGQLALRGAAAAFRSARLPFGRRIAMAGWFLALCMAPAALVPPVVRMGFGVRGGGRRQEHERQAAA